MVHEELAGNVAGEADALGGDENSEGVSSYREYVTEKLERFSVWQEESVGESIYEIEVNKILENEFESCGEGFEENGTYTLAVASCSRSNSINSQSPSEWVRSRRRHGSDSSRHGSECCSPGYRYSVSTNQSDRCRRPSYTCLPFHHRRHYAVRRKAGPHQR